jgi:hypothetical protein
VAEGDGETTDSGATSFEEFVGAEGGLDFAGVAVDYEVPARAFKGFSGNVTAAEQATLSKKLSRFGPQQVYKGSYLVNESGLIDKKPYNPNKDVFAEMYSIKDTTTLRAYQSLLYSRGFYGRNKPSLTGTMSTDRSAFKELLTYANSRGYTWQALIPEIASMPMTMGGGGRSRYRVSAPEDITEYLRQASLEKLGRTMSKEDVDKAIAAIQQTERTKGPDAPAMQVAAAQQVSAADPDREKSVRFRRGIDIAMNLLGG